MGIKDKMIEKTVEKVAEKVAVDTYKKQESKKISTENTFSSNSKLKSQKVVLKNSTYKHFLVIDQMNDIGFSSYKITDENKNVIYTAKGSFFFGKHRLKIYNSKKELIGIVRKNVFVIPDILFDGERKARQCHIIKNDEKYKIRTRLISKRRSFITKKKYWKVKGKQKDTEFEFCIKNEPIGVLQKIDFEDGDRQWDKYLLLYEDTAYESEMVLLSIAIDTMIYPWNIFRM